jgi:type IV pilus assembly protein PilC
MASQARSLWRTRRSGSSRARIWPRLGGRRLRPPPVLSGPRDVRAVRIGPSRLIVGRVLGGLARPGRDERAADSQQTPPAAPPERSETRAEGELDGTVLRLLADTVAGGMPFERALLTVAGAVERPRMAATLRAIHDHIAAGRPVDASLRLAGVERHLRALISGGSDVGRLAEGLASAATLRERQAAVRRQVRSAMVYPLVVMLVAVLVLVIVSVSVVPQLEATFIELGSELPTATRAVMVVAGALRDPFLWGAIGVSGGAVAWSSRRSSRTPGRARGSTLRAVGQIVERVPIVGRIRRDVDITVATRVIATLVSNGAPLVVALQVGADSSATSTVREGLASLTVTVAQGGRLASCPALAAIFTPIERELLAIGEERGLLAAQWERLAERRLDALEARLQTLGSLVEPLMVVVVGLVVGGTVTALYLPSFRVLDLL